MSIDYAYMQRACRRHKSALTRAENRPQCDPPHYGGAHCPGPCRDRDRAILHAAGAAMRDFAEHGYPDAWARWDVAGREAAWRLGK